MKNFLQQLHILEIILMALSLISGLILLVISKLSSGHMAGFEYFSRFEHKIWQLFLAGFVLVLLPVIYVILKETFWK
jgi:uncharacterized membrane protein